ncbi:hypothetical protein [Streptomyces sp. NBC_01304]|uniref:hypothetical protein n=1 Tax=Streptomyces sp. NBC_01304 TaxID=2903818 RepID=UPI002E15D71D|nr:hypothetical protein OG430_47585 [Streptomyces sp. NBC_01304]
MTKRNTIQQRARELQQADGISYLDALTRVRDQAQQPAAAYVLQPTPDEAAAGVTAEQLGVRALPPGASPARRAHAEAVWHPSAGGQPCRCSGTGCHHGAPCEADYAEGLCGGPLLHRDRYPGSMFSLTIWQDVYRCEGCGEVFDASVEVPSLPWGEVRTRDELDGTERTLSSGTDDRVIVLYDGIRHPNFPDHPTPETPEGEFDEIDPDQYPTPEDEFSDQAFGDDDQAEPEGGLNDYPSEDFGPVGVPEEYDDRGDADEDRVAGRLSLVPALDLDPQPSATDWPTVEHPPW